MQEIYVMQKQRERWRLIYKLKIYGAVMIFFALIIGIIYLAIYSPILKVKNITITEIKNKNASSSNLNNEFVTNDNSSDFNNALIADLKYYLLRQSKLALLLGADNFFIWSRTTIDESSLVKREHPELSILTLNKDYFKREIDISLEKRKKFGIWCELPDTSISTEVATEPQSNSPQESVPDNCFWFDKDGIIFAKSPRIEGNLIYRVDDFSKRLLVLGDTVLNQKLMGNLIKIFDVLGASGLKRRSLKLENLDLEEVVADPASVSTPKIYFSLRNDPSFALKLLQSLKNLGLDKAEYIDLRVENRVYYK